jgi:egghead protein (zeste-white 4 protein)
VSATVFLAAAHLRDHSVRLPSQEGADQKRYNHCLHMVNARTIRRRVGYYAALLVPIGLHVWFVLWYWEWSRGASEYPAQPHVWLQYAQLVWLLPAVWSLLNLFGLLCYGPPPDSEPPVGWKWRQSRVSLIFCYVSRGDNSRALAHSVRETQRIADLFGVPYVVEVLTDLVIPDSDRVDATSGPIHYEVVPGEYRTLRGARYKARALQYGLEKRERRQRDVAYASGRSTWILHLDEESVVTPSAILGIHCFVTRHDLRSGDGAIGQGEILYNGGDYGRQLCIAAIDAVRSGDDLGRFRLQYRGFQRALFGMHGSYVLIPAEVEARVGWDLGASGSITEDAAFALYAMQLKVPFDWVEGFVQEQSPFSIRDIIQQRRRWLTGLNCVATNTQFSWQLRLPLALLVVLWKLSWLATVVVFIVILSAMCGWWSALPRPLMIVSAAVTGTIGATYMMGAYRNVLHSNLSWWRGVSLIVAVYALWLCLIPAIVEGLAVLVALLNPARSFHVVDKNLALELADRSAVGLQDPSCAFPKT